MIKRDFKPLLFLLIGIFLLCGCSTSQTTPEPHPTATPSLTSTSYRPAVTATTTLTAAAQTVTQTIAPPTQTPVPSSTLSNTPTVLPPTLRSYENTPLPAIHGMISPETAGRVVPIAQWGKGSVQDIAYSSDRKILGIATSLGLTLYDNATQQLIAYIQTHESVVSLLFIPDSELLALGLANGEIEIRRADRGELLKTLNSEFPRIKDLFYNEKRGQLIAAYEDNDPYTIESYLVVWNLSDGKLATSHILPDRYIYDLSLDGQTVVVSKIDNFEQDQGIEIINIDTWQVQITIPNYGYLHSASLSPDGNSILYENNDGVILLNFERPSEPVVFKNIPYYPSAFFADACGICCLDGGWIPGRWFSSQFTQDGKFLVLVIGGTETQIRSTVDGSLLAIFLDQSWESEFATEDKIKIVFPGTAHSKFLK